MEGIEKWELNWAKVLNGSVTIRNHRERIAFEELLKYHNFATVEMLKRIDDNVDLKTLKSLIPIGMAWYVKLNNRYWFRLTPLGALESDVDLAYN